MVNNVVILVFTILFPGLVASICYRFKTNPVQRNLHTKDGEPATQLKWLSDWLVNTERRIMLQAKTAPYNFHSFTFPFLCEQTLRKNTPLFTEDILKTFPVNMGEFCVFDFKNMVYQNETHKRVVAGLVDWIFVYCDKGLKNSDRNFREFFTREPWVVLSAVDAYKMRVVDFMKIYALVHTLHEANGWYFAEHKPFEMCMREILDTAAASLDTGFVDEAYKSVAVNQLENIKFYYS